MKKLYVIRYNLLLFVTIICINISCSDDFELRHMTLHKTEAQTSNGILYARALFGSDWTLIDSKDGLQLIEKHELKMEMFPQDDKVHVQLDRFGEVVLLGNIIFLGVWEIDRTETTTTFHKQDCDGLYCEDYYITFKI